MRRLPLGTASGSQGFFAICPPHPKRIPISALLFSHMSAEAATDPNIWHTYHTYIFASLNQTHNINKQKKLLRYEGAKQLAPIGVVASISCISTPLSSLHQHLSYISHPVPQQVHHHYLFPASSVSQPLAEVAQRAALPPLLQAPSLVCWGQMAAPQQFLPPAHPICPGRAAQERSGGERDSLWFMTRTRRLDEEVLTSVSSAASSALMSSSSSALNSLPSVPSSSCHPTAKRSRCKVLR